MQRVRTQMRVPSRRRQTVVRQQVCHIFEGSTLHSQTARKRRSQVVPMKVLDLGPITASSNPGRPFSGGSPVSGRHALEHLSASWEQRRPLRCARRGAQWRSVTVHNRDGHAPRSYHVTASRIAWRRSAPRLLHSANPKGLLMIAARPLPQQRMILYAENTDLSFVCHRACSLPDCDFPLFPR